MSVEPGVVDANILVYAINPDAPRHASSHALLEEARDPSARLYVTPQILCEFYSIITNPRRVAVPTPPADAVVIISGLLAQPGLYVLPAPEQTVTRLINLLYLEMRSLRNRRTCLRMRWCAPSSSSRHAGSAVPTLANNRATS